MIEQTNETTRRNEERRRHRRTNPRESEEGIMTTTSTRTSKPTIGAGHITERRRNDERDLFARSRGLIRVALVVAVWAVALTPRWSFSAPGGVREPLSSSSPAPSPTDLVMGGGFSPSRPEAPGGQTPPCQHKCEDHPTSSPTPTRSTSTAASSSRRGPTSSSRIAVSTSPWRSPTARGARSIPTGATGGT